MAGRERRDEVSRQGVENEHHQQDVNAPAAEGERGRPIAQGRRAEDGQEVEGKVGERREGEEVEPGKSQQVAMDHQGGPSKHTAAGAVGLGHELPGTAGIEGVLTQRVVEGNAIEYGESERDDHQGPGGLAPFAPGDSRSLDDSHLGPA